MPNDSSLRPLPARVARFDPVSRLFLAQDRRPGHLADVDPGELSPLQRALLVIDGTVTSFLSAWALEPVAVQPLGQRAAVLPDAVAWLDAPAGTPVVERQVLLRGADSQRLFAHAESLICVDRLPATLRAGLESGGLSLGQLLLMPGFESRREGLWYGRERPLEMPDGVRAQTAPDFLTRAYRVSAASRPLMLITERFPWALRD
ncbi:MAG: chorismate pyruvate-lyase family protein [Gammaproteobacteria bacterium]